MRPVRFLVSLVVLVVTVGLVVAAGAAPAGAQIKLTPTVGPPTSKAKVSGRGFGASEAVDVTFDMGPVATATTDPTGAFTIEFKVPASATPGTHTVTATGESSGLTAGSRSRHAILHAI